MIRNTLISFGRASISIGHIPDGCLCKCLKICALAQLAMPRAGQEGSIVHDNSFIKFAAGRAAVKPACRSRQARGLRRRSEYG